MTPWLQCWPYDPERRISFVRLRKMPPQAAHYVSRWSNNDSFYLSEWNDCPFLCPPLSPRSCHTAIMDRNPFGDHLVLVAKTSLWLNKNMLQNYSMKEDAYSPLMTRECSCLAKVRLFKLGTQHIFPFSIHLENQRSAADSSTLKDNLGWIDIFLFSSE